MHFSRIVCVALSALLQVNAQTVQCNSLAGGCSDGTTHDAGLRSAIAKFQAGKIYGGGSSPIVFASSLQGSALTQIAYSCSDGSIPPPVTGSSVQSSLQSILSCANQCGSISVSSKCGFGVLTANDAAGAACFAKALNVDPPGRNPAETPLVGTFLSLGCWTDSINARALTGGSLTASDMSVEKCVGLAKGFKYAGVEYATECYWGNTIASTSTQAYGQCAMVCAGSPSEICGDGNRIDIYQDYTFTGPTTTATPPSPTASPTLVPTVGSFQNTGCVVDSISARVLIVASTVDASATGMTVEKCIAFAERGGFRYAGVEYGSECFVGNTIHNGASASQNDCSMPCAGNLGERCGNGNRIQIYEDSTWSNPVAADLVTALQNYYDTLAQFTAIVAEYKGYLLQMRALRGLKVKRQVTGITPTDIEMQNIRNTKDKLGPVERQLEERQTVVRKVIQRANSQDIPASVEPLVNDQQLTSVLDSTNTVDELSSGFEATVEDDVRTINSQTPLMNTDRDLAVVEATTAIGIPAIVGQAAFAATGIFYIFAVLISIFKGPGSSDPVTTPPSLSTTTNTTTTTTSSATATGTPYFIAAQIGANQVAFENLMSSLPRNPDDVSISYPLVGMFGHAATFDETILKSLKANPLVMTVLPRYQRTGSPVQTKRSNGHRSPSNAPSRLQKRKGPTKDLPAMLFQRTLFQLFQANSEPSLQLISSKNWFEDSDANYNGKDYLYDATGGAGVALYIIDSGIQNHPEFSELGSPDWYVSVGTQLEITDDHGTCVASLAVGNTLGLARRAKVVNVKTNFDDAASQYDAFVRSCSHAVSGGFEGKAVINMSFGSPALADGDVDFWPQVLTEAISHGIVVVAAAGNNGDDDEDGGTTEENIIDRARPSTYGSSIPGFIVVGSVGLEGFRSAFTPRCTEADLDANCIQAFAVGESIKCATSSGYGLFQGTSFASPQVAGLAASLLTHPNREVQRRLSVGGLGAIASNVETLIDDLSYKRFKGTLSRDPSPAAPNVIFNGACLVPSKAGDKVPVVL